MARLTDAQQERVTAIERNLYEVMPGAEPVPRDARGTLWGEVENTPHYKFCHLIAHLIVINSGATFVDLD